jgi:hypothetical protein
MWNCQKNFDILTYLIIHIFYITVVHLMIKGVGSNETSAASVKLEGFNGEWEVVIIRVKDKEAVDDFLLETAGLITWRD